VLGYCNNTNSGEVTKHLLEYPYATIISTDTAHALIDTIITLDKNIIDYIMKY